MTTQSTLLCVKSLKSLLKIKRSKPERHYSDWIESETEERQMESTQAGILIQLNFLVAFKSSLLYTVSEST